MSLFLGRKSNGEGLLHMTSGSRTESELKNNSQLSDTTFSSDLPYLRVIEEVRVFDTYLYGDSYYGAIPSRAKQLVQAGYLYTVQRAMVSYDYWTTAAANSYPDYEKLEPLRQKHQCFPGGKIQIDSSGNNRHAVSAWPSSGSPTNSCPWHELVPSSRGAGGYDQLIVSDYNTSNPSSLHATGTTTGSLSDIERKSYLAGCGMARGFKTWSGMPNPAKYTVDKNQHQYGGSGDANHVTSQYLYLYAYIYTFYNFKLDFASGNISRVDPASKLDLGIYVDSEDIRIGSDFTLIGNGKLLDLDGPVLASHPNKSKYDYMGKTRYVQYNGKLNSAMAELPLVPVGYTSWSSGNKWQYNESNSSFTYDAAKIYNSISVTTAPMYNYVPDKMMSGTPYSLEMTNSEIKIHNSNKTSSVVIASPGVKATSMITTPIKVVAPARTVYGSTIRGGTARSSPYGTFYEKRYRVATINVGKTIDNFPVMLRLNQQGFFRTQCVYSGKTGTVDVTDSTEETFNLYMTYLKQATKNKGNNSQYDYGYSFTHKQFVGYNNYDQNWQASFFLEMYLVGSEIRIDQLFLYQDMIGSTSPTFKIPEYSIDVFPLDG